MYMYVDAYQNAQAHLTPRHQGILHIYIVDVVTFYIFFLLSIMFFFFPSLRYQNVIFTW